VSRPVPIRDDAVKILMVDDQPGKLLTYEAILEDLGEILIKASSGREALEHLLKHDVAVVLIDVQMPEVDGFELAGMIREHPRFQQTALIFVSAIHLSDLDRIRGYEAGAVDYVPVPVVPEVLRAKVRVFSELHRKTRALEQLNLELEQRVADRTAALEATTHELQLLNGELEERIEKGAQEREQALAQLFEAQKVDTIGQLTGGVAHDFNNLLMAMMGSMQLLRKKVGGDAGANRLLDNALSAAERGAALTQRLLAFARRQDLSPKPTDVVALIGGIRDLLERAVGPNIRFVEELPDQSPTVLIDPNQLELALLNLAVNARDAMPDGGEIILKATLGEANEYTGHGSLKSGKYCRLRLKDTGAGMAEEVLSRATEPFFTTKGVGKGTGLGLSMVHGLAAQSGGALKIESTAGVGTTIELWIPLAEGDPFLMPLPAPAAEAGPMGRALSILLVDDDMLVLNGTLAMLEDLGHRVQGASSGEVALDMLRNKTQEIDLIITDHAMPGLTGAELARKVRSQWPGLAIILASGFAELSGEQVLDPLPRLSKPFSQNDLARMISDVCSAASGPRASLAS
jgi:signal transduction histidine kinase